MTNTNHQQHLHIEANHMPIISSVHVCLYAYVWGGEEITNRKKVFF